MKTTRILKVRVIETRTLLCFSWQRESLACWPSTESDSRTVKTVAECGKHGHLDIVQYVTTPDTEGPEIYNVRTYAPGAWLWFEEEDR